jgi:hypothetical protein
MSTTGITAIAALALIGAAAILGPQAIQDAELSVANYELPTLETIKKAYGISDLVWDCAADALSGKDVDGLVTFIESEVPTAGTPEETPLAGQLKACVYQDPFGWHGTENEWAIELLNTEEWK